MPCLQSGPARRRRDKVAEAADIPPEASSSLRRALGLWGVFSIAAGAMISSGLFVLPGLAFRKAGPAAILSYALASLLVIPVMLSKAELATAMPKSGGSYFYIERSLGPLAGTFAGLASWLSIALKGAFALVGIGALTAALLPQWDPWVMMKGSAVLGCLLFAGLNVVGAKHAGRLQVALVFVLLGILIVYAFTGVRAVEVARYSPFVRSGNWGSVFAVAGMVFVSFGGLTKVVGVSEEVRKPTRNLPLGMFLAFGCVSVLYVLVVFVTVGLVSPERLGAPSLTPIADGARVVMGPVGLAIVQIAALLAFATTANSGILSASRSPMAMSRDGLLPGIFARTSKRFGTPGLSIAVTAAFMGAVILLLSIEDLVKTASTMILLMFLLVNVSIIIMRQSGIQNYRPTFRAPLYPWLQIAAIIAYGFLIFEMGTVPLLLSGLFALAAVVWYLAYVMRKIRRESALVHLVNRVVSRRIVRSGLEDELKHIILERDEISLDRFDGLVRQSVILDLSGPVTAEEMFREVADAIGPRLNMDADRLYELFLERERQSSTVVVPGIAIPHVVIDGQGVFDLLLVRCRKGIVFREQDPPVTTAFILLGSPDERNYHLRALMNIAHIVEGPGFRDRWKAASGPEQLRDIVLLAERRRE